MSSARQGRVRAVTEGTLEGLAAGLVASRHAGGYRFRDQERALRQFAAHCRQEGYPDGSITQEAVNGLLYGRHLRAFTIRRNALALRQLAGQARAAGWEAFAPAPAPRARVRRQPPCAFTDDEVRRLFTATGSQPMSACPDRALVDPVLFRVLCGAGLRVSGALHLTPADAGTRGGTLRVRGSKNGESRTVPVTARLAATLAGYIAAAHPAPEISDYVFCGIAPGRPIDQSTVYLRFRNYLADAGIPRFTGGPHPHSLRHGFAVANLRRWAAEGTDLAVVLPCLACRMGHADLRGTQYYLQLTADACPGVMARAQARFGYVIPAPPGDQP